jgi:hypothetical protein
MQRNWFDRVEIPPDVEMVEVDGKMVPLNSTKPGSVAYGIDVDTGEYVRGRVPDAPLTSTPHLDNLNKRLTTV